MMQEGEASGIKKALGPKIPSATKVDLRAAIRLAIEGADDWEKFKTSIPGIYIVKVPDRFEKAMLMFNPPDSDGNPRKKKGFFFDDLETAFAGRDAFEHAGLEALVRAVNAFNDSNRKKTHELEDVIQVTENFSDSEKLDKR